MNRPVVKPLTVAVHHGDLRLGDADLFPAKNQNNCLYGASALFPNKEIRISYLSPSSERCPPLSVLHTISPYSLRCKLLAKPPAADPHSHFYLLYFSCFQERKTAVVVTGEDELHLVAMPSKVEKVPCFWCCSVRTGMYGPCMAMLNLRCLAIVFDLDETLFVANTMKSFEDRIDALSRWIDGEKDPAKRCGMSAELKRLLEDRDLLKQYIDSDNVSDNGKLYIVQNEEVPAIPGIQACIARPVIRLQEKNIVLTRINPEIRDTSVLVRLRPAWEDLRSYLTAKGRKRFEVYVCTMADRDYAFEMWRLLDPEAHLINPNQLVDRIMCVKSGSWKSLLHVFQDGHRHPKMAMVIDDRQRVWDDKDQPRVHVVPPFSPYYAPMAEMAHAVPVLCVARNVACNVRGGFFKEFDEKLLHRIYDLFYENEIHDLPRAPDVSYYLISEDSGFVPNGSRDFPMPDGMSGVEVEQRPSQQPNLGDEQLVQPPQSVKSHFLDSSTYASQGPSNNKDGYGERGPKNLLSSAIYVSVLQEIGRRCDLKVDFRCISSSNKDMHFSCEVLFNNEKIGIGMGRTKGEATLNSAENALQNLSRSYMSYVEVEAMDGNENIGKPFSGNENGFLPEVSRQELPMTENLSNSTTVEQLNQEFDSKRLSGIDSKRLAEVLSSIKELCVEGQDILFEDEAPSLHINKADCCYIQVVVAGQILGKGVGSRKDQAKLMAAEEALKALREAKKHSVLQR